MNGGIGPNNRTQNVLNVQPVIPFNLNGQWNLITRTILPIIKQPTLSTTSDNTWGLGSAQFTALFSPAHPGPVIWWCSPVWHFCLAPARWVPIIPALKPRKPTPGV